MRLHHATPIAAATRRAFSFLEIMLVVMIIGIMLAVVGPRLVGKSQKAKITATRATMDGIGQALGMYEQDQGNFPTTEQGIEALVTRPSDVDEQTWSQYLKDLPVDAWNQPLKYASPGENGSDYDLISSGPDRRFGTEDDITNHGKKKSKSK